MWLLFLFDTSMIKVGHYCTRNDSKPSDHKQHNFATEDNTDQNVTNQDENNTERSSTIDIVELTDQGTENEWVSLDS